MKNNILIFCSWLNIESNIGIFFAEQAELMKPEYNPILVFFKKVSFSRKNISKHYFIEIIETKTSSDIPCIQINFPQRNILPKFINKYFEKLAILKLNKYLKDNLFFINFIHAQSIFDGGIWAYRYFKKYQTPYIITEHNQISFRNKTQEKVIEAVCSLENSKKNLVVSNDKIRQFAANGLFYNFINVGNLVSMEFKCNNIIRASSEIHIITIGAFTPIKDQTTLLNALKILDDANTANIVFTWVGIDGWGGDNEQHVNRLIKEYCFKNIKIRIKPTLDRIMVAKELNESDLFIFSSLSEGMPVSVLESLACGTPVFTTNCGGVDEVINDKNGKIYPIKDYYTLADLIIKFINKTLIFDRVKISKEAIDKNGESAFKNKLLAIYNNIK